VPFLRLDDATMQMVHGGHRYFARDILWGHRLCDVLTETPDGHLLLDLRKFHHVEPTERGCERINFEQIALGEVDTSLVQVGGARRIAHEGAHLIAALGQSFGESASDLSGRSGDEDLHGGVVLFSILYEYGTMFRFLLFKMRTMFHLSRHGGVSKMQGREVSGESQPIEEGANDCDTERARRHRTQRARRWAMKSRCAPRGGETRLRRLGRLFA
jgi:hypothetical protein